MTKTLRSQVVLASIFALASTVGLSQTRGAEVYSATCKMCHGASGAADTSTARMLKVKPVSDSDLAGLTKIPVTVRNLTDEQMFRSIRNGKGTMRPMPSLSDTQIKDSIFYFKSLAK